MKDIPHDNVMAECFRSDPAYAQQLLAEVRADGSPAEMAILLRQITLASKKTFDAANIDILKPCDP